MRPRRTALLLVVLGGIGITAARDHAHADRDVATSASTAERRPEPLRRRLILGHSVERRPITAYELGDRRSRRKVLVVGCIHGDEAAGVAIVHTLDREAPIRGVDLWLIPTVNPDGEAAHTRQNAHGVDLNRNFPWQWQPLGPRGTQQYAGPRPLSEPESRIAHSLIARLRPSLTIWFHQPLGLVDESGGSLSVERRFARLARLPLRRLARYPGSAASWQNHRVRNSTAFVVELPPGTAGRAQVKRWSAAVRGVAAGTRDGSPRVAG